ncbi:hypothetical protein H112_00794 [Trichophyton rubrum D6]|uniref:Uncharacterized protein n=3 Tax=Trichophyton TaxID=5550 RepID=A0A080WM98_TRIRC|nr:uncharacterized protein TERG_12612 [Trichophyton rubrum CBS 118892]EZF27205.1 hypothetical protein H100_00793 [Trichophyton rubrum MR850]EZF46306.1 hypothetical protein H102_00784 [Trichophyton rubrum CBS 100081]EZF56877.1 hypothetical protein H103_00792 [Trichophyton rubrum CBS 288.86]EZF67508.1 hypothetical protein H104_00777 [Trichophyton rubrum CBS 289.86]EZF78171.1 hypothetical protein H105_00788 [Trichophyton soudanense CBS 452.61]EZF88828.1 hypothetical protein H110_00793 [Trichophy
MVQGHGYWVCRGWENIPFTPHNKSSSHGLLQCASEGPRTSELDHSGKKLQQLVIPTFRDTTITRIPLFMLRIDLDRSPHIDGQSANASDKPCRAIAFYESSQPV